MFCQVTRTYIVGRITGTDFSRPPVLTLKNAEEGIFVDVVMLSEDDVSIVFRFTRSYFHVDLERVDKAVVLLGQLLPGKPFSERFTVLGGAKLGKTERYRKLIRDAGRCSDQFGHAAGDRLLKHFGVTRHDRAIFYGNDELCQVSVCRFREGISALNEEDQMRGEAWFHVANNDVFPELLTHFLTFSIVQRELFVRMQGDVLRPHSRATCRTRWPLAN